MSKRPHDSHAAASASEDLVERLKAAGSDDVRLREIIESYDSASVAGAFAVLLAGGSSTASAGSKLPKKAHGRPFTSLPAETLLEAMMFADRDTLDRMQLSCGFLLNIVNDHELSKLPLRTISKVDICKLSGPHPDGYSWISIVETVSRHGARKEHVLKAVHQMTTYLRMAFCELVSFDLTAVSGARDAVFDHLAAPNTFVGTVNFLRVVPWDMPWTVRGIEAFKSVERVVIQSIAYYDEDGEPLGENFLVRVAQHGVRHIEFKGDEEETRSTSIAAALSFGFSEPTYRGDRSLLGVACDGTDFLAQVKQSGTELEKVRLLGTFHVQ